MPMIPSPAPKRGIPEDAPGLLGFRSIQKNLEYLYDRWRDEPEYEEFSEYQSTAKKWVEDRGMIFVKLTKTPFALTYKSDGHVYTVKITARNVSISRVTG